MAHLQVVSTPTIGWLAQHALGCSSRMLAGSPFVNNGIFELTKRVSPEVPRVLVTRTDLRDFAIGASDLKTLCTLARDGVEIYSLSDLHAKMYIFDETHALVTSANATNGGLRHNLECGLATDDRNIIRQLATLLLSGLGADRPPSRMRLPDLDRLYGPLEAIKVVMPERRRVGPEDPRGEIEYSVSDVETLLSGFTGWRRLTLEGVLAMPEPDFRLTELFRVCRPVAARRYPRNHHVRDKLRQQLQMLKKVGLIDFVEPGHYRRTMRLDERMNPV